MSKNINYKKPFLKEVILRIDFPVPTPGLEKPIPENILKIILKNFPISEPQKLLTHELQLSIDNVKSKQSEITEWVFHSNERDKTLKISSSSMIIVVKKYTSFENLYVISKDVIEALYKKFKELIVNRIGLRYVNIIEPGGSDPLSWADYINEKMLGIIDFNERKDSITRAFHILEYNFNDIRVKFQFGIANPDYPAIIKKKQFVLDIDSYANGAFELQEILANIEAAHEKVQEIFESSITDKTRHMMG
ncbi:TIGR04255 family protein [Legionella bozemanae]|uniref:TIGR04255 family protein n=1 Tax=Legionella bozemanae TaxID=447 RepID=UPI001041A5BB|nr:TIGR04255 family protein [Legionella bozemanae]HEO1398272.1 TIGR04255 family protein [Legionella pneumophila]